MIITCPNCGTRYRIADTAVATARVRVQCASCATAWAAWGDEPSPDLAPEEEDRLDAGFVAPEADAEPRPETAMSVPDWEAGPLDDDIADSVPVDAVLLRKRRRAMEWRQRQASRQRTTYRLRRVVRSGLLAALTATVVGGFVLRAEAVSLFPELAGPFALIGLPVNVVGLDFLEPHVLHVREDGGFAMQITAGIVNVSDRARAIPPVLVSLLDAQGAALYEWTLQPQAQTLLPGERIGIETRLAAPPGGTARLRLSFVAHHDTDGA